MHTYHTVIVAAIIIAVSVISTPLPYGSDTYKIKESHVVPSQWSFVGDASPQQPIKLHIGLKQTRVEELTTLLYEVSDPSHSRYGQYLTRDEVNELVRPTNESLKLVRQFLEDAGVRPCLLQYSPAEDWISLSLLVRDVEALLDTKYFVYENEDGDKLIRAPVWSLPANLHGYVDTIQPTNSFSQPRGERATHKVASVEQPAETLNYNSPASVNNTTSKPRPNEDLLDRFVGGNSSDPNNMTVSQVCNADAVTPLCLRTLYGTLDYQPQAPDQTSIGLTNFIGESNNRSDIGVFLRRYRPDALSAAETFGVETINGGDDQQTPNTPEQNARGKSQEGNLDAETILGIAHPIPLTAFSTGGEPPFIPDRFTLGNTNEPYIDFLQYILNLTDVPSVISISYGDSEQTVPISYASRVCDSFAQLGARGVSVLFASGDNGVGRNGFCEANDGTNAPTFLPVFPASCPFVTGVGATKNFNPEVAAYDPANGFASGGGFSNYFGRPQYQNASGVVDRYIKGLGNNFSQLYNQSGRAYPDVSAQGQHYTTIWNGALLLLDGTSASTPTVASIIALVNDALVAAGKPVLGFLNPWLYSKGYQAFTDVLSGSAVGCNSEGFPVAEGWDPVTGFGTPYFPKAKALALDSEGLQQNATTYKLARDGLGQRAPLGKRCCNIGEYS